MQEPDLKLDEIDALKAELAVSASKIFAKAEEMPVEEPAAAPAQAEA